MKELYNEAELKIIFFEKMDVIRTSDGRLDEDELPPVPVN